MKDLINDLKKFWQCKAYMIGLSLIAMGAYGFAVTHHAIGMDDTAVSLYFEEGLAPYVGRWSLFLINKIFHIGDFMPWMVELVSVMILMLSVTLWCILWDRVGGDRLRLPAWSYVFVAGVMISCPLISEVFVFYLHNGVCTGYGVTALALMSLIRGLEKDQEMKKRFGNLVLSMVLLSVALGFYESFVMVYVMGAVMVFFLLRMLYGKCGEGSRITSRFLPWAGAGILSVSGSLVIRAIVLYVLELVCQLDRLAVYDVRYRKLFGDIFTVDGELSMVLKRHFVKYYVNSIVYLPIAVLLVAFGVISICAIVWGIRKKDILMPICIGMLMLLPVGMSLVEGHVTFYRSAQYVPLVSAFAVFLVLFALYTFTKVTVLRRCVYVLLGILLFNQCMDSNRWFYVDWLKYQNAKEVMDRVAYDLRRDYDITKPIIFRGGYRVPYEVAKDVYVSFGSEEYQLISSITDIIDVHLKEKFFAENGQGYIYGEMPIVSILQWGTVAFDNTSEQLIRFWKMHGQDGFRCEKDLERIKEAEKIREKENMPGYPEEGYIKECDDYIIVNLHR